MNESDRYLGREDGGVPLSIFEQSNFTGFFRGKSGAPLYADIKPNSISISDNNEGSNCHFIANVFNDCLTLDARTKTKFGQKHPDLFASLLVQHALDFFKRNQVEIKSAKLEWLYDPNGDRTSDVYFEFFSYLENKENPSENDLLNAASKTSISQLLIKNNFTVKKVFIVKLGDQEKVIVEYEVVEKEQ